MSAVPATGKRKKIRKRSSPAVRSTPTKKSSSSHRRSSSSRSSSTPSPVGTLMSVNCVARAIATHVTRSARKSPDRAARKSSYRSVQESSDEPRARRSPKIETSDELRARRSPKIHRCMRDLVGRTEVCIQTVDSVVSVVGAEKKEGTFGSSYMMYQIELQRPKTEILTAWFRYSVLRSAAERMKSNNTSDMMRSFPRKSHLFESTTEWTFVRERRANMESWLSRTVSTQEGMLWLVALLEDLQ